MCDFETKGRRVLAVLCVPLMLAWTGARADDGPGVPAGADAGVTGAPAPTPEAAAPAPVLADLGGAALSPDALAAQRGGTETLSDMKLGGVVANNQASDLVTGHNIVSDGSLTGNAGFATVVQNTGNNVLIQNATIINLQLQ